MELTAAIQALSALKRPSRVVLHTDSQYVKEGITRWLHGWVRKGWKTASREPVKNFDLWQALLAAMKPHDVHWAWVRGHSGNAMNERADALATAAREELHGRAVDTSRPPATSSPPSTSSLPSRERRD